MAFGTDERCLGGIWPKDKKMKELGRIAMHITETSFDVRIAAIFLIIALEC